MAIHHFPPHESASPEGLLAVGGDLEIQTLKLAYSHGIFPWPTEEYPLLWFSPPKRAILFFDELKIPRRYQRERKKFNFSFKIDQHFSEVIHACADGITRNTFGTWITPEMIKAYCRFHEAGYAHSFECYNSKGKLVGGMYGVSLGQMFAGESMFFWESGASKECLLFACEYLKKRGAKWMDTQMISPVLAQFGTREIRRSEFLELLHNAIGGPTLF